MCPTCWQTSLLFEAGTSLLVAGVVTGAGLELAVTCPMTKATLRRTSMAAVTRRIRRARPVVWTKAGTAIELTVMVLPFLLLFQPGLPSGLVSPTAFRCSGRALWSVWAGPDPFGYTTYYGCPDRWQQAYPESHRVSEES